MLLSFFFSFIIIVHCLQYLEVCLKSHFAPVSVSACHKACLSYETTVSPSKGEGVPGPPHCPQACLRQVVYSHTRIRYRSCPKRKRSLYSESHPLLSGDVVRGPGHLCSRGLARECPQLIQGSLCTCWGRTCLCCCFSSVHGLNTYQVATPAGLTVRHLLIHNIHL